MLVPLALAQFICSFAGSNMNVMLNDISEDLDTTVQGVQTAITIFLLVMAALMIPGGKLTDIFGRTRCFTVGLVVYGVLAGAGRGGTHSEWLRASAPMATMALGSLLVAIAYKYGPASLVTPLAGAYPVVTLAFAWIVLKERPTPLQWGGIVAVLVGMVLTTAVGEAA